MFEQPSMLLSMKENIVKTLARLDPSRNREVFEIAADGIIRLETDLSEMTEEPKIYAVRKLKDLSSLWPNFEWVNFTQSIFERVNVTVKSDEPIQVTTPGFFVTLSSLLERTPPSVLEDFAKWQLIRRYLSSSALFPAHLTSDHESIVRDIPVQGRPGQSQRYKQCIQIAQDLLPIALTRTFANHVIVQPKYSKGNASSIMHTLKSAFRERIATNTWLDSVTKDRCKEKVDAVSTFIDYPDQLFNDAYLNSLYSEYEISSEDFFGNYQRSIVLKYEAGLKLLHQKVDKANYLWSTVSLIEANAYYFAQLNSIVLLEGIMQAPISDAGWPDYFKYGSLGAVLGHELTHGFDNRGRLFDKDGNYRTWWTNSSIREFDERKECFVNQYSEYEMFGIHVDGNHSLPDNIADNGGLKVAFQAYKDLVNKNSKEKELLLPALSNYTPDQLYFIAWAQVWCSAYTKEGFSFAADSNHAPGPFRVLGTVTNSEEFSDTFDCPVGSPMNPTDKCMLW